LVAKNTALVVLRDGLVVGSASWGTPMPVDPGEHMVMLTAPGKRPWWKTVIVGSVSDQQTVVAERLEDLSLDPPRPADPAPISTAQKAGLITAGVGVLSVGVGSYFGIRAIHGNSVSDGGCDGNGCDPWAKQARLDARTDGNISTVAFLAGGAFIGAGAALYFLVGNRDGSRGKIQAIPAMGKGEIAVALRGTF